MALLTPEALAVKLSSPSVLNDTGQCRQLLTKVMTLTSNKSVDLSPLMPVMVNLLANSNLLIKKTACNFLSKTSGCQSELMLLAVNTLLKDSRESNPMTRGLALRAMCAVNHEAFIEHRLPCIVAGLKDSSSYVRRTAAMSCVTISKSEHENMIESGIVDTLYELIRDPDPVVVVNCLLALEDILKEEGGIVMSKNMVKYLVNRFEELTAWGLGYVLKMLHKYTPKSEEEIFDLMNVLDSYLQHNNCTVSVNALELFLFYTKDMPHLVEEVFQRSLKVFLGVLSSGNVEMMAVLMQHLQQFGDAVTKLFSKEYKSLFCQHKDPAYLKEQKLQLLTEVINVENFKDVLEELVLNCSDRSASVSLCAIQGLGKIIIKFPDLSESLLKGFKKLLSLKADHVLSNTLQVLVTLPLNNISAMDDLIVQLCVISKQLIDTDGITSALCLIGRFGGSLKESTYLLEDFMERFSDLDSMVKGQLLMTGIQIFCKRPAECQNILGELLDKCLNDEDRDLNDQARFYYHILKSNVLLAEVIFEH